MAEAKPMGHCPAGRGAAVALLARKSRVAGGRGCKYTRPAAACRSLQAAVPQSVIRGVADPEHLAK